MTIRSMSSPVTVCPVADGRDVPGPVVGDGHGVGLVVADDPQDPVVHGDGAGRDGPVLQGLEPPGQSVRRDTYAWRAS